MNNKVENGFNCFHSTFTSNRTTTFVYVILKASYEVTFMFPLDSMCNGLEYFVYSGFLYFAIENSV